MCRPLYAFMHSAAAPLPIAAACRRRNGVEGRRCCRQYGSAGAAEKAQAGSAVRVLRVRKAVRAQVRARAVPAAFAAGWQVGEFRYQCSSLLSFSHIFKHVMSSLTRDTARHHMPAREDDARAITGCPRLCEMPSPLSFTLHIMRRVAMSRCRITAARCHFAVER